MKMHNPPHPGEGLKTLCLVPLHLSVTEAARALGVSRKTLSGILNGRAGISPEMAVGLSIAFDTSAESWLNQQVQYDLACGKKSKAAPGNEIDCCLNTRTSSMAKARRCPSADPVTTPSRLLVGRQPCYTIATGYTNAGGPWSTP
jgi:addiction module HigA family antidote